MKQSNLIERAEEFARKAHKGQKRKVTGEPYVNHPIAVAEIVQSLGLGERYIAAALLHDTVEDTKTTLEDIHNNFGTEIAIIVGVLTKEKDKEKYVKRFLTCEEPIVLIKLADVYHNSQTADRLNKKSQKKMVYFANKYYIPIAAKLCTYLYTKINTNIKNLESSLKIN